MARVRLYLDEDVDLALALALRARKIDAVSALELGRRQMDDANHLAYAVTQQRAILTHNRDDFLRLAVGYFTETRDHFGIVIAPQYPLGEMLRRVLHLVATETQEGLFGQVRWLQAYKPDRALDSG